MFSYRKHLSSWSLLLVFAILLAPGLSRSADAAPLRANLTANLIQTIDTSIWSKPSPDPSGITYWPGRDTLLVSDGEVEEMPNLFQGDNLFESSRTGTLVNSYSTTGFSEEPTGIEIEVDTANSRFYISDDSKQKVFVVNLGGDRRFGTGDDSITSFSTTAFGNRDPEGLAFGGGKLFITDGAGAEMYVLTPGNNGVFDGVAPGGDDQVSHFDTGVLGQPDPEGVDYNPGTNTIYIISNDRNAPISETTTSGSLVNSIDISVLDVVAPGDITIAPGSQNSSVNTLYIVDRGVDNNNDPNENDGKIFEIELTAGPPPGSNRLLNGGFELDNNNDNKPDIWSGNNKFTRSSAQVHGGSYSGRFFATDNSGATIKQVMNNVPAGNYSFNGWVLIPPTSDTFNFKIKVKWRDASNDPINTVTIQTFTASTTGTWVQVTRPLTAPAGTAKAEVLLDVANLNATIYVDDLEFS
ncbi:MAG TPA: hypothetical protein VGD69_17535 [Herpetosiphonaceae bacterium]